MITLHVPQWQDSTIIDVSAHAVRDMRFVIGGMHTVPMLLFLAFQVFQVFIHS
jgi:hypothetical protein